MNKNRIGLFKSALESMNEQTTSEGDVVAAAPEKTEEIQPTPAAEEPPKTDAEGTPEQAPAEVQAAIAETAEGAPEVAVSTGVTTDEDPAPLEVDPDAPPLEDTDEECELVDIAEDVAELAIRQTELDSNGESLSKAATAVDELEDLVQTTEQTGVEGESAAIVLELAVEHVLNSIGLESHHFAMEDSSGIGASVSEKLSTVKDVIVRLLKALMEAIKRGIEHVREYLGRLTQVAGRIEKAALELRKEVAKLKEAPVKGQIKNDRLTRAIGVSKDVSIARAFQSLAELTNGAYKSANSGHIEYLNSIVDSFLSTRDDEKLINDFPKVLARAFDEALPNDGADQKFDIGNVPANANVLTSNLLPGVAVGVLLVPKTTADLNVFSFSIEKAESDKFPDEALDILNKGEMLWLLESVIKSCVLIRKFHRDVRVNGKLEDKISQAVRKVEGSVQLATPEFKDFLRSITAIAPALAKGIHEKSFAYALQCNSAALRYVETSLKKQTEAGEAAKAE